MCEFCGDEKEREAAMGAASEDAEPEALCLNLRGRARAVHQGIGAGLLQLRAYREGGSAPVHGGRARRD